MQRAVRGIICIIAIFAASAATAKPVDPLRQKGETTVFAFRLKNSGKYLSVSQGKADGRDYLVCRFGKPSAVELEFPAKKENSWDEFSYWWYLRGGGPQNDGMDLNYLAFVNNDWEYVVYEEYAAVPDTYEVGVLLVRPSDCKYIDLLGVPDSVVGALMSFRDNENIVQEFNSWPGAQCDVLGMPLNR
ncbi:MAG: hypothetical protein Q3M30_07600 [Candidatus Electrothrix sp. Rat3]|nr:hypothetical protein [Candidatus Electrothrix rattekaaiensis]